MKQDNERTAAGGILHDLDDIRSLLDDSLAEDAIPVLEDRVGSIEPASLSLDAGVAVDTEDLALIPVLDDPIADDAEEDDEAPDREASAWVAAATPAITPPLEAPRRATTREELLALEALQLVIRDRIDATLKRWVNETLEREMTLLRARLLDVVHDEVHAYLASRIGRGDGDFAPSARGAAIDSRGAAEIDSRGAAEIDSRGAAETTARGAAHTNNRFAADDYDHGE